MRKLPQNGGIGMTDQEKTRISELRSQGRTYQEIAVETGIGLSAIKMHFKRLKPEETAERQKVDSPDIKNIYLLLLMILG